MSAAPHRLAHWTWLLPLPLLHLATWLSLVTQFSDGASLWYVPFGLVLVLVQTILMIARNLGLECVAEGIESEWQLDCLRNNGCSLGQGYYFSRPLQEADFLAWMAQHQPLG